MIERLFQILAVILAGLAAFLYWKGFTDGLYLATVAACVSFFLSVRFQVKERNRIRDAELAAARAYEEENIEQGETSPK